MGECSRGQAGIHRWLKSRGLFRGHCIRRTRKCRGRNHRLHLSRNGLRGLRPLGLRLGDGRVCRCRGIWWRGGRGCGRRRFPNCTVSTVFVEKMGDSTLFLRSQFAGRKMGWLICHYAWVWTEVQMEGVVSVRKKSGADPLDIDRSTR